MKITSVQRDISLNQGKSGLHSEPKNFKEKSNLSNRGYNANNCGSFTGKSEAAATVMKKGGLLSKKWFKSMLTKCDEHNIATSALVALVLAGILRPATILALPGEKDKEDKIYASGHAMASAILGFAASTILTSPLDEALKKAFKNPNKFNSKKLSKMERILPELEKRANKRDENGKIIFRKSRELFKKATKHKNSLNTLVKNIPDWIIAVPRSILTIALIPPILKYVFGVEKKKKQPAQSTTANTQMNFVEKPVFQQVKGGVK